MLKRSSRRWVQLCAMSGTCSHRVPCLRARRYANGHQFTQRRHRALVVRSAHSGRVKQSPKAGFRDVRGNSSLPSCSLPSSSLSIFDDFSDFRIYCLRSCGYTSSSLGSSRSTALNGQTIFFIRTIKGQLLAKDQLYPTGVGVGGALVVVDDGANGATKQDVACHARISA